MAVMLTSHTGSPEGRNFTSLLSIDAENDVSSAGKFQSTMAK